MLESIEISIHFSMLLSLFLFAVSVYLYRKSSTAIIDRLLFSILVVASFILYLFYAVANYFTGGGINNAVIYHLKYGLVGAGFLEYWKLIVVSIVYIIFGLIFAYWVFLKKAKNKTIKTIYIYPAFLLILLSILFSPASSDLYNVYSFLWQEPGDDFNKFYEPPRIKQVDDNKNLVFIYAEGLERTYFDETIFPGLIRGLRQLQPAALILPTLKGWLEPGGQSRAW